MDGRPTARRLLARSSSFGLGTWQYRARTFAGRKLVVATMVLSLLWYQALHTIIQPKTIKRWQRFIIDFVVAKKVPPDRDRLHRISTTQALTPPSEGGLGLPDISTFVTRHKLRLFQELAQIAQSSTVANVPLWAVLPLLAAHAGEIAYSGRLDDVFILPDVFTPPPTCRSGGASCELRGANSPLDSAHRRFWTRLTRASFSTLRSGRARFRLCGSYRR